MPSEKQIKAAVAAVSDDISWVAALIGGKYDNAEEVMRDALTAAEQAEPVEIEQSSGDVFVDLGVERPAPAAQSGAVKVRVGEIMEAAWPEFGGNHQTAEFWQDFNEGVTFALKYLAALEPAEPSGFLSTLSDDQKEAARNYTGPDTEPATDVEPIPRADNCGRYLAELNDGRLLYLNHANTWQECPNFITRPPESRLREALEGIDSIITNSINENGSDYHRMKIGEEWYDGPVVDALHKILMGLREIARAALAQGADDGRS